ANAFDIASIAETLAKSAQALALSVGRVRIEKPDHRLLRAHRARPGCRRATEQRYELAPSHVAALHRGVAAYHTAVGSAGLCITAKLSGRRLSWVRFGPLTMSAARPL